MKHAKPVRLQTAPTGPDKSGSKTRCESVHLFLEFTIIGHSKFRFIEDARRVGTGAVANRPYRSPVW